MEQVLFRDPWVPYNDSLVGSRLILTYPQNLIFVVQMLTRVLELYRSHPFARKVNVADFQKVHWDRAIIVLDRDLHLLLAPDPVHALVRLDRRLRHAEAVDRIFFRFPNVLEIFKHQWLGLFWIWIGFCVLYLYRNKTSVLELATTKVLGQKEADGDRS